MKYIIILLTAFSLLISCQTDEEDGFIYEFSPPKITLASQLIANKLPEIMVTRSLRNDDVKFSLAALALPDALVIFKAGTFVDTLRFDPVKYLYTSDTPIQANDYYDISVSHKQYNTVYVDKVFIPSEFTILEDTLIKLSPNDSGTCGSSQYFNFSATYKMIFPTKNRDTSYLGYFVQNRENICKFTGIRVEGSTCNKSEYKINENFIPLDCIQNLKNYTVNVIGQEVIRKKITLTLRFGVFNKDFYANDVSTRERLGVELGLLDRVTAYSNVRNGYGLVVGLSEQFSTVSL